MTSRHPKAFVIVNPASRGGRTRREWPALAANLEAAIGPITAAFTDAPGAGRDLAQHALKAGHRWLITVGGDGTISEVVAGMFRNGKPTHAAAALSFIMRGTGNDLRRTLTGARDTAGDIAALASGRVRNLDVGHLKYVGFDGHPAERYFINLASFGLSGTVDQNLNRAGLSRVLGGTTAFAWATAKALVTYRNPRVVLTLDGGTSRTRRVRLVAVANGKFAGGGMCFAPEAEPDDGWFDVVIIGNLSRRRIAANFRSIYRGTHVAAPGIEVLRAKHVFAEPDLAERVDVLLDVDGEAPGRLPAEFTVIPGALKVRA